MYAHGQNKPLVTEFQSWANYNLQTRLSRHFGLWMDAEAHSQEHYFNGVSLFLFRLGGTYYNKKNNKYTVGYGYASYLPGDNHKYISVPEHHAWQQYQWFVHPGKSKIMQWVRLEEKLKKDVLNDYVTDNTYSFMYKFRYNFFATIPLTKKGLIAHSLAMALGDELYLYYEPGASNNHLYDQNRVFTGFSYSVNGHDDLVFGLTHILQENASATQYKYQNILKLSFFQKIAF